MPSKSALILIDLQRDFCTNGSLAVPDAETILPIARHLQTVFPIVVATQDWHPADHSSFAANHARLTVGDTIMLNKLEQQLWPVHCVQNTLGAELHPLIDQTRISKIIYKGTLPQVDSYSGFFDNHKMHATEMHTYLQNENVKTLYICGLATDYCVKFSVLDALALGYEVFVIMDACRGIASNPEETFKQLQKAGAKLICARDIQIS